MPRPETESELKALLSKYGADNQDWSPSDFGCSMEEAYFAFELSWAIWQGITNPNSANLRSRIERYKELVRKGSNPDYVPISVGIIESWLEIGIDESEITSVVREAELEGVMSVIGWLEQGRFVDDPPVRYKLVAIDEDDEELGEVEINDALSALFVSSMPKGHPRVAEYG